MEKRKSSFERDIELEFPKQIEVRRLHKKERLKNKKLFTPFMKMIFLLVAILALLVTYRYAYISSLNRKIISKANQLEEKEASRDKIYSDIMRNLNISTVEDIAKNSLGMIFPKDENIIYMDLED